METRLEFKSANFLQYALSQGENLSKVLADPAEYADKYHTDLSKAELYQIKALEKYSPKNFRPRTSEETTRFIREVVKDGRYIIDWKYKPEKVAKELGLSISDDVVNEIGEIDLSDIIDTSPDALKGIAIVSIAVAVIVTASGNVAEENPIIDFSGITKL